jgi:protein-disulfide isomerase
MTRLKVPVTASDHYQGNDNAPAVVVEYGDYECPYCGAAYPIVKRLQEHFGSRMGFVFRNFPLAEIHTHAENAAESAEFAAVNDRFWEMHDGLYENQDRLSESLLLELAEDLGLSAPGLRDALSVKQYAQRVRRDFLGGVRSGVNGTPTFFINGQRHDDSIAFESLVAAIEAHLANQ